MATTQKGIGKGVVIALGVLVVIFAFSTVYVYSSLQSQINALNTDKSNLQSQVNTLSSDKNNLQSQLNSLNTIYQSYVSTHSHTNSEYDALKNDRDTLKDIVDLRKSTVWIDRQTISQPAGYYTYWTFQAPYAGYVSVNIESSTTDKTYVQVVYTSRGVNYDEKITIGISGTAVFPVLPSSNIQVRVGNTNLLSGATETITVTYYY